jgi:hypothetical protein
MKIMNRHKLTKIRYILKDARELLASELSAGHAEPVYSDYQLEIEIAESNNSERQLEALVELSYRKTYDIQPERR